MSRQARGRRFCSSPMPAAAGSRRRRPRTAPPASLPSIGGGFVIAVLHLVVVHRAAVRAGAEQKRDDARVDELLQVRPVAQPVLRAIVLEVPPAIVHAAVQRVADRHLPDYGALSHVPNDARHERAEPLEVGVRSTSGRSCRSAPRTSRRRGPRRRRRAGRTRRRASDRSAAIFAAVSTGSALLIVRSLPVAHDDTWKPRRTFGAYRSRRCTSAWAKPAAVSSKSGDGRRARRLDGHRYLRRVAVLDLQVAPEVRLDVDDHRLPEGAQVAASATPSRRSRRASSKRSGASAARPRRRGQARRARPGSR